MNDLRTQMLHQLRCDLSPMRGRQPDPDRLEQRAGELKGFLQTLPNELAFEEEQIKHQLSSNLSLMLMSAATLRNGGGVGHVVYKFWEQAKRITFFLGEPSPQRPL